MNVSQFLRILVARWRIPAITMLLGLVLATVWIVIAPSRYTSVAQVLIDVRPPASVAINGDPGVMAQLQPDYLATQVDVIQSNTVALAAIDALGLVHNLDAMDVYRASYGFVNADLASIYQVAAPEREFDLVQFPDKQERPGRQNHSSEEQ